MTDDGYIINFDAFDGDNPWAFLSNFYVGDLIQGNGAYWLTGEHLFQSFKAIDAKGRKEIAKAATPGEAKRRGRKIPLRDDWEAVKYDAMAYTVRRKFAADRPEARLLLATQGRLLVEGTAWRDKTWGVAGHKLTSPGRNWLGTLLMARRAELRAELEFEVSHDTARFNLAHSRPHTR
jgi:ribA/ribD-fused uncharacterized protein